MPTRIPASRRTLAGLGAALALVGVVYAGYLALILRRPPAPPPRAPGFAGSPACGECHGNLAAAHGRTPHARALHVATAPEVLEALPASRWLSDPETGLRYQITQREGALGVETDAGGARHWQALEWAFGSGTHAITPVGRTTDGNFVEAPLTFYRTTGWDFTPGFLGKPVEERRRQLSGNLLSGAEIYDCFHCHTAGAQRSAGSVDLTGAEFGVQCESCHGPSAAHAAAARAGRPAEGTLMPGSSSAQSLVTFCATCHRDSPPPGLKVTDPVVARFAPVGFQESACFRKSGGRFSCLTCHDPHRETPREAAFFRGVCAGCHGAGRAEKACPVQPAGDCVSCHMPRRIIQRNGIFTDHWIRVVRESGALRDNPPERDLHRLPQR